MKMSRNLFVSYVIIFATTELVDGQRLFINSLNQDVVFIYENRNHLYCKEENNLRASEFSWFYENGSEIKNDSNIDIQDNGWESTLIFKMPNDAINGDYACQAKVVGKQFQAKMKIQFVNK
ncbi:hypothetical protein B4U80_12256, partial [Leptotrombidium deliense]